MSLSGYRLRKHPVAEGIPASSLCGAARASAVLRERPPNGGSELWQPWAVPAAGGESLFRYLAPSFGQVLPQLPSDLL